MHRRLKKSSKSWLPKLDERLANLNILELICKYNVLIKLTFQLCYRISLNALKPNINTNILQINLQHSNSSANNNNNISSIFLGLKQYMTVTYSKHIKYNKNYTNRKIFLNPIFLWNMSRKISCDGRTNNIKYQT